MSSTPTGTFRFSHRPKLGGHAPIISPHQWELHKDAILEMYRRGLTKHEIREELISKYDFKPSLSTIQLSRQLLRWWAETSTVTNIISDLASEETKITDLHSTEPHSSDLYSTNANVTDANVTGPHSSKLHSTKPHSTEPNTSEPHTSELPLEQHAEQDKRVQLSYADNLPPQSSKRIVLTADMASFLVSEKQFNKIILNYVEICKQSPNPESLQFILERYFDSLVPVDELSQKVSEWLTSNVSMIVVSTIDHYATAAQDISMVDLDESLDEKLRKVIRLSHSQGDSDEVVQEFVDNVRSFLFDDNAFQTFLFQLRCELAYQSLDYMTRGDGVPRGDTKRDSADDTILVDLELKCEFTFHTKESLPHDAPKSDTGNLLTIVGRNEEFIAIPCADYLLTLGIVNFKSLLNTLLRMGSHSLKQEAWTTTGSIQIETSPGELKDCHYKIDNTTVNGSHFLELKGQPNVVHTVMKAVFYLAAALRPLTSESNMCSVLEPTYIDEQRYRLACLPLREFAPYNGGESSNCWERLFSGTVIVSTSPIPGDRQGYRGLEIFCPLMLDLADPFILNVDEIGIWLESSSFLLIPMASPDNTKPTLLAGQDQVWEKVQWHLQLLENETMQYNDLHQHDAKRLRCKKFSGLTYASRTFLGYCGTSKLNLGVTDWSATNSTGYSQCDPEQMAGTYQLRPNIQIGVGYKGFIVASLTTSYAHYKNIVAVFENKEKKFVDILKISKQHSVVLYDDHPTKGGRAWLVPMTNFILYLIHLWAFRDGSTIVGLPAIDNQRGFSTDASAAYNLLLNNRDFLLQSGGPGHSDEDSCVDEFVRDYWEIISSMVMKQIESAKEHYHKDRLCGWDIFDTATRDLLNHRKEIKISPSWLSLANRPDILVFFAYSFGDIIEPTETLCPKWHPDNLRLKQYLTATSDCLESLVQRSNPGQRTKDGCIKLGHHVYWPLTSQLFQKCSDCLVGGECSKSIQTMQETHSPGTSSFVHKPNGAVIFGGDMVSRSQLGPSAAWYYFTQKISSLRR